MHDIFGIPLTAVLKVLLALLALGLGGVGLIAWRRPITFKLGLRNIPRRPAQTILVVVGLMLSTLLIAAALGTGDTLNYSMTTDVYDNLGQIDELVVSSPNEGQPSVDSSQTIPASAAEIVDRALAGASAADGVLPLLEAHAPALNQSANLAEPDVMVMGLDPERLGPFGGLQTESGDEIDLASIKPDEVVLSAEAASRLGPAAGDTVTIFYDNKPRPLSVAAVATDSYLSGVRRGRGDGLVMPGMVMPLANLQELTNQPDRLSAIAISNQGGVRDSLGAMPAVMERLTPALKGTSLGVAKTKRDAVDQAQTFAQLFTGVFLVLGLFSIAAGVLLIVLIFSVLAAERRAEMGMARAIGMQRRQLVEQFVSEGAGYAIAAGFVGAGLGALTAIGIGYGIRLLFGDFVPVQPHVTLRSMVVAYCLGVVITLLTVLWSSWRISRLDVVAAIRDLPEEGETRQGLWMILRAAAMLVAGVLLTLTGRAGGNALLFLVGMSLIPFGLAALARRAGVSARPVYTLLGVYLLALWLLPSDLQTRLFGPMSGGFELFFAAGLCLVVAATLIIIQNTDLLLTGLMLLGGLFRSWLPAVRTAVAYPAAIRGRTGLTIAMFSLIVFSLVMMATISENFVNNFLSDEAKAGWDVRADAYGENPLPDFRAALQENGVDTAGIRAVGITTNPHEFVSQVRLSGHETWKQWLVYGMNQDFIAESDLSFQQRATGYGSDAAILKALQTEPNVAVVDAFTIPSDSSFAGPPDQFQLTGLSTADKTFAPITVDLADPGGGPPHPVKIIGVIDSKISSLLGIYANQATIAAIYPKTTVTSYFLALRDPGQAGDVAKQTEHALLQHGVQATSIDEQLAESQRQSRGFLYIIQGFMGLGLVVGVAAVGVIAFRSVVERRQEIGMLRAIGFQRAMVGRSFLIETAFVVGLGIFSGTLLGWLLARNLVHSDKLGVSDASFTTPWTMILTMLTATLVVALLMTWIPARQASRIAPAEALRYE
jgi:putative ABC transport system permease protein